MLSIAVCDDEMLECHNLAARIRKLAEKRKLSCELYEFQSGTELMEKWSDFDMIFLDIMMKDMDGMKTAKCIREHSSSPLLIFVSSSREYVFDAYEVEAFDYLVKPVEMKKLEAVFSRALTKRKPEAADFIVVHKKGQSQKLVLKNIYYFEIMGRVVYAHGVLGTIPYYGQIGELEHMLAGKGFFRCHKSYLVNLRYVDSYNRQELQLENGESVPVAKRRYEEFGKVFLDYVRGNGGLTD